MNIFKRSQKINSDFLFEKIMNHSKNTFDKNEMDFLQTPLPENIQDFFELYKNLSSFKKSIFFDRFKEFADNIESREKQLKVNLFSQSLIRMCLKNIHYLILICIDRHRFGVHMLFVLFDASEKFNMSDDFKCNIIDAYNYHTKNEIGSSAIIKPYFDMKKEEMGYGPFQKKDSL